MTNRHPNATALVLLALCLTVAACGRGPGAAPTTRFEDGGLAVEVSSDPPTPREGTNRVRLRVLDAAGAPVDDAAIVLRARMDMAGMAAMQAVGRATPHGGGIYEAEMELPMAGTWRVALEVVRAGGTVARAQGSLTTGASALQLAAAAQPSAPPAATGDHEPVAHPPVSGVPTMPDAPPGGPPMRGEIQLEPARMRQVGIRSEPAAIAPFERVIRAVGRVTWDEKSLVDVSPKVGGWVERLDASAVGDRVERGQPLLWLYSPALYAGQQEYLSALRSQRDSAGARTEGIARAARHRLRLFDLADADVDAIAQRGTPSEALPLRAPASGIVIEKDVTLGAAVEPGRRLFRIAPAERVWIEAELQEDELAGVAAGDVASVTLPSLPGRDLEAKVDYVYPYLDGTSRSGRVRLTLANADLALRPDMYADVSLRVGRGERLQVPASAVLYTGPRRLVFVDRGDGRVQPREITVGATSGERVEVLSGLAVGERVIVAGTFLVAAESRLQAALDADAGDAAW